MFMSQAGMHQGVFQPSKCSWKFEDTNQAKLGVKTHYLKNREAFYRNPVVPCSRMIFVFQDN